MRTLFALVFACFSFQASAFDLGALNEQAAIACYEYTASLPRLEISSVDESIDPTVDWLHAGIDPTTHWTHLDYEWDYETTASISGRRMIPYASEAVGGLFAY